MRLSVLLRILFLFGVVVEVVEREAGDAKLAANWVMGELSAALNKSQMAFSEVPVSASTLGKLIARINDATISGKIAKAIFDTLWREGGEVDSIIEAQGLRQVTDSDAISGIIEQIIADNPAQVAQFKAGKEKVFGFFVGKVMQASASKANPQQVNALLRQALQD